MEKGWIEVYTTSLEHQAAIAKDLLEIDNIAAVIINQKDSAYQTFGEFTVLVAEENKAKALEILKNLKH
jgi:hypothetical protein